MTSPSDDRSPMAIAAAWSSRLMTVAAEMVVPGVGGYWVDQKLGTKVVFTLVGFGVGLALGMWHLLRMTQSSEKETPD